VILLDIIKYLRDREYMSGVEARDKLRIKQTAELFTPTNLVREILDKLPQELFADPEKTFLDNSCGDGQLLSEVLIRKVENNIDFEKALSTIYGVDLMSDNVQLCRDRLLCGREDLRHIVEKNIVCADGLRYHYRFDGSHPYDDEAKELNKQKTIKQFFEFD
jgi:hypothetical protein